jgi:hypothetical protein
VGFEVSNGGVVPPRLVIELFIDCIVLVRVEVELFMDDEMNENLFCSRQRKNLRRDHSVGLTMSLPFFLWLREQKPS